MAKAVIKNALNAQKHRNNLLRTDRTFCNENAEATEHPTATKKFTKNPEIANYLVKNHRRIIHGKISLFQRFLSTRTTSFNHTHLYDD